MPSGKRRPKGEGSITVLPSGKVRIRVELEPVDGKRKWLTATAASKKEAVEKLKKLQRTKEDGVLQAEAAKDTIDYQIKRYLRHLKAQGLAGNSILLAKTALNYLRESSDSVALSRFTSSHMDKILIEWRKKYKARTIHSYLGKLKTFFEWCLEQNLIEKTPILSIHKAGKMDNAKLKLTPLSRAEHEKIKAFLLPLWQRKENKVILRFKMLALYCLVYETGIREGEVLVLTWDNLDVENCTISVNKTLARDELGNTIIDKPKTQAGFRTIKISEYVVSLLEELRPSDIDIEPYIFYNRLGRGYYPQSALIDTWNLIKKNVGITREFTFHDLRHTNASNMIYQHVPIAVITQRLGHSSISITYNTYGHIIQECEEANIAVIKA